MKLTETKLQSKKIYSCFFMDLFEDDVLLPNNKTSKRIYIKHNGAAAILSITKENKLLLIKQFRYPVGQIMIEIPAGKLDGNESGMVCARRELEEETGYTSDQISKLFDIHSCVGYSNERIELYLAQNCMQVTNPRQGDDDEFIELLEANKEEAKQLLSDGLVTDAKTIIALQHYINNF